MILKTKYATPPLALFTNLLLSVVYLTAQSSSVTSSKEYKQFKEYFYGNASLIPVLSTDQIIPFTHQNYSIVFFGAPGCKSCQSLEQFLTILSEGIEEKKGKENFFLDHHIPLGIVNMRTDFETAKKLRVTTIPQVRLYHNGLHRVIPLDLENTDGIKNFVHQRIHLKKIPIINSKERLTQILNALPHCLVLVSDGEHRVDHVGKQLLRNIQFTIKQYHLYIVNSKEVAQGFGLAMHGLYEINTYDKKWKRIEFEDLVVDGQVDEDHFRKLRERIYRASHPKVQMMDLKFMELHGLEDALYFYSTDSAQETKSNKKMALFNQTCQDHLFIHTRCTIFSKEISVDSEQIKSIFQVQLDRIEPNTIVHIRHHRKKREPYVLQPSNYSTGQEIIDFYHHSQNHTWPVYVEASEEIPDNTGREIEVDSY